VDEQQVLTSIQNLRQKAYQTGNLANNDYINVEQEEGEIIIETLREGVIYVPYYDTRIVYGNWWWQNHPPYYWHRPAHSIFNAGVYWSIGFNIHPSFYFGGFNWRNRHVVANYHYRSHANRYWSNNHNVSNNRQVVRVKEYPRWSYNQQHRRGAQHRINGQRILRNINSDNKRQNYKQIDKKRVLNVNDYSKKHNNTNAKQFKQALGKQPQAVLQTKLIKNDTLVSNKKRIINHNKKLQNQKLNSDYRPNKNPNFDNKQKNSGKSKRKVSIGAQSNKVKRSTVNNQKTTRTYKSNNERVHTSKNYQASPNKQNKSRPIKVSPPK
jgi:hypothetical protein